MDPRETAAAADEASIQLPAASHPPASAPVAVPATTQATATLFESTPSAMIHQEAAQSDGGSNHNSDALPRSDSMRNPAGGDAIAVSSGMNPPVYDYLDLNRHRTNFLALNWQRRVSTWGAHPLTLLELPEDILRLILKEITHTNDLTALALTNSTLHDLAVPHIYARFDIVWPDANVTSSDTKSVDALTYGLSTLCLGSSFARMTRRYVRHTKAPPLTKLMDSNYAQYTRKFSLGNGPSDWVAEYMITKESGKMLGTLVALAVGKMVNLENFVWDMPTGVLSDIFMALGSLSSKQKPGEPCKLERIWIRWHDNDASSSSSATSSPNPPTPPQAHVPIGSSLTPIGILLPSDASHPKPRGPISYAQSRVEYPTFSVLPPLRSLTVLDIDELAYLDEMAVLIRRSRDRLQELRVGISSKVTHKDFVQTWDGPDLQQVDHDARWPGESRIGERRLGGVLGVLVGRIYDIRRKRSEKTKVKTSAPVPAPSTVTPPSGAAPAPTVPASDTASAASADLALEENQQLDTTAAADQDEAPHGQVNPVNSMPDSIQSTAGSALPDERVRTTKRLSDNKKSGSSRSDSTSRKRLEGKLKLHTLELERIPLSMQVCSRAIDWTCLTNLTILECAQHENLWKQLKAQFPPTPMSTGFGISASSTKIPSNVPLQYRLCLKRLHTDITSASLITFIKETLAPNSLETLFLQDRPKGSRPPIPIEMIFKGVIKRHRSSLKKLLLDSSARSASNGTVNSDNIRWRNWVLPTEILLYITSGRMTNLNELAVSLDYKDWHTFLQRLPNVPQLRSVNIPYVADHIVGHFEPRELALQIADIITLRPEIQLCYVGISSKCFEILEVRADSAGAGSNGVDGAQAEVESLADGEDETDHDSNTDDDDDDDEDDDEETDEEDEDDGSPATDPDETQSENSDAQHELDDDDDDDVSFIESEQADKTRLRLREILFYDDKVAIFKARHGKL